MSAPRILRDESELETAVSTSKQRPVFVFKHSLACPVSSAAWQRYCEFVEANPESAEFTVIEIQNTRELSQLVAERTSVRHESPQALLLEGGEVRWHASHWGITQDALGAALAALRG